MNASQLSKLYDRLTVWERIPLLIAAEAREDAAEYRRLFEASALRTWRFSEHLLVEQALHVLALLYVGEQLSAAAGYFFAMWQMEDVDPPRSENWLLSAQACAYFFAANADAWRQFCAERNIAPEVLTAANHRGWFLRFCEDHLPERAPTAEALQALFRKTGQEAPELVTAEDLLANRRSLWQQMTSHVSRDS